MARPVEPSAAACAGDAHAADYFRLLPANAGAVDAWTTEYLHVLPAANDGVHPVVAWIKGTTLTPFLAALPQDVQRSVHRRRFGAHCRSSIRRCRMDGFYSRFAAFSSSHRAQRVTDAVRPLDQFCACALIRAGLPRAQTAV